jgi:hypothetical protein
MRCPDDALLDQWLDDALAAPQAAAVAAHLDECGTCAARRGVRLLEERGWRAALALDTAELAYLVRADLAATWRQACAPPRPAYWWPALVALGMAGAYATWLVALPALGLLLGLASRLGLVGLALAWLLGQAWNLTAAALKAFAAPPLVDPILAGATIAACLWLVMTRPWEPALARRTAIE